MIHFSLKNRLQKSVRISSHLEYFQTVFPFVVCHHILTILKKRSLGYIPPLLYSDGNEKHVGSPNKKGNNHT